MPELLSRLCRKEIKPRCNYILPPGSAGRTFHEPGKSLAFKLSGEGVLAPPADENGQGGQPQAANRPGGGLGPPIDAPPPLRQYQWWILGGFAAALILGGIFIASRQQSANRTARGKAKPLATYEEDEIYEPAPVAAALANAVFDATGVRLFVVRLSVRH